MKLTGLIIVTAVLIITMTQAHAVTLTFDDVPQGMGPGAYYNPLYHISFDGGFYVIDHTGSSWGPPHSGSNVLAWRYPGYSSMSDMMFKNKSGAFYAHHISGYFSTEPDAVLQMTAYHNGYFEEPVASAAIGAPGESWNNVYVEMNSWDGFAIVLFSPVTTDALTHFCADDMTLEFIPEPSSLAALCVGLVPLGLWKRKWHVA